MIKGRVKLLVLLIAMISTIIAISGCSKKDPKVSDVFDKSDGVEVDEVTDESEESIERDESEEIIEPEKSKEVIESQDVEDAPQDEETKEPEEEIGPEVESEEIKESKEPEKAKEPEDVKEPEKVNKTQEVKKPEEVKKTEEVKEPEEIKVDEKEKEPDKPTEEVDSKEDAVIGNGIKDIYGQYDLLAGTCINENVIRRYSDHIKENYNSVTMENEMKPDAILNRNKSVAAGDLVVEYPKRALNLLDFAKANNMKIRGHTLVWHSQTPDWIFYNDFNTSKGLVDRDTMLARMESYIKQNFELLKSLGYIDLFYAYDVVNEAIDGSTLRNSKWKDIIGDDYIWYAFYYADKYAPEYIKLYYNDFNEQFKTNQVVELAKSLVDENGRYLIDGIGCQGHLYTNDSIDSYIKTLEAFSATGLDVQITEIDISLGSWQNILQPTEENLKNQGRYYYELVNKIIEGMNAGKINISGITFWGVSDGASWRGDRSPLLFNRNMDPKYAYYGAIQDKDNAGY